MGTYFGRKIWVKKKEYKTIVHFIEPTLFNPTKNKYTFNNLNSHQTMNFHSSNTQKYSTLFLISIVLLYRVRFTVQFQLNSTTQCYQQGYFINNRCHCSPKAYSQYCHLYNDTCSTQDLHPLNYENKYELRNLDIQNSRLQFQIETPLYSNRQYSEIYFNNASSLTACSYPNYEQAQWIKNISSKCKEQYNVNLEWNVVLSNCHWIKEETSSQLSYRNQIVVVNYDQFNVSNIIYQRTSTQRIPLQITLSKIVQTQQNVRVIGDVAQQVVITLFSFDNAQKQGKIQFTSKTNDPYTLNKIHSTINSTFIRYELLSSEFVNCEEDFCVQHFLYLFSILPSFDGCELYEKTQISYDVDCKPNFDDQCSINPSQRNVTVIHEITLSDLCLESQIDVGLSATLHSYSDFNKGVSNSFALNTPIYLEIKVANTKNVAIEGLSLVEFIIGKSEEGVIEGSEIYSDESLTQEGQNFSFKTYNSNSNILRFSISLTDSSSLIYDAIAVKVKVQYASFIKKQFIIIPQNVRKGSVNTRSSLYGLEMKGDQNENSASSLLLTTFQNSYWVFLALLTIYILL